jgi:eukaryotic-like serine/threonine-protein kinase
MAETSDFQLEQDLDAWWDRATANGHSLADPEPIRTDIATVRYLSSHHIAPNPDPAFVRGLKEELLKRSLVPNGVTTMPVTFSANSAQSSVTTRVRNTFWPEQRRRLWGLIEFATAAVLILAFLGTAFGGGPFNDLHSLWPQTTKQTDDGPTGMYRGNAARTGVSTDPGPIGQPELKWKQQYHPTGYFGYRGTVIVAGNRLYLSQDHDGKVISLDATTGNLIWSANVGTIADCPPAVGNGLVYVSTAGPDKPDGGRGYLFALDEETGTERWRYETGGCTNSSPAIDGNTVYIAAIDGTLHAVDAVSGQGRWHVELASESTMAPGDRWAGGRSSPAVSDGAVYVATYGSTLFAIDAHDGHELWRFQTDGDAVYTPAIVDGTAYFTAFHTNGTSPASHGWVYAVEAATGKERWRVDAVNQSQSAPVVADGLIFLGSTGEADVTDSSFTALDAQDGHTVWSYNTPGIFTSNLTYANGVVYGTNDDGGIYALDAQSGDLIWRANVIRNPTSDANGYSLLLAPTVAEDLVIVPMTDGTIYAFGGGKSEATPAASPTSEPNASTGMYRGNAARTGVSSVPGPSGQPELKWRQRFHAIRYGEAGVAAGGAIYLSQDERGEVIAVDATTGKLIWTAKVGVIAGSPPAVGNGTVYVATAGPHAAMMNNDAGYLVALDAATGVEKWRFETGGSANASPVIDGDMVYFENVDQTLFAVDAQTGHERWRAVLAEHPIDSTYSNVLIQNATAAVSEGIVFAPNYNGTLFAIDAKDGHEHWRFKTDGRVVHTPAVVDSVVYFTIENTAETSPGAISLVYAVDAASGAKRWRVELGALGLFAPAVADGLVFIGARGGPAVYALNANDGATVWQYQHDGSSGNLLYANGIVYGSSVDGVVYAFEAKRGSLLWRADTRNSRILEPVIVDDLVVVPATDGRVYAIGGDGTVAKPIPSSQEPTDISGMPPCNPPRSLPTVKLSGTPAATFMPGRGSVISLPEIHPSEIPKGEQASEDTKNGILETLTQIAACDFQRVWSTPRSFYSDDYLRRPYAVWDAQSQTYGGAGPIVDADGGPALTFDDARVLPDGRVGVVFNAGDHSSYLIFSEQDGNWLIDEQYQVVGELATPEATPESR